MRTVPLAMACLLGTATLAFATDTSGTIAKVDPKTDAVTLDDGQTYILAEGTEAESLNVGEHITVTYHMKGAKRIATKVVAVQ